MSQLSNRILASVLLLGNCSFASAQSITYRWSDLSNNFSTDFGNVQVGSQISLRLWVEQSGGNPLGSDGGMFAYAGRVRYDNPLGSTIPSTFASIVNPGSPPSNFGPDFTPTIPPVGAATINGQNSYSNVFNIASSFSSGVLPDANGRIMLGTVRFTGQSSGLFSFRAEDPHPAASGDFTTFNNLSSLDSLLVNGVAQFTVVPAPEPTALLAVGFSLLLGGRVIFRKRKQTSALNDASKRGEQFGRLKLCDGVASDAS